jgi:hypothetical protein
LCNRTKTKLIIAFICLFSLISYSFTFFASGFEKNYENSCVTLDNWINIFKIFLLIDTIQTLVLPFIVLSILNISIGYKILHNSQSKVIKSRKRLNSSTKSSLPLTSSLSNRGPRTSISFNDLHKHQTKSNKESNKLFIIASIFLLLNFPITFNKCYNFFSEKHIDYQLDPNTIEYSPATSLFFVKVKDNNMTIVLDEAKEIKSYHSKEIRSKLSSFVYYINFSINFFLYTFNLRRFKNKFIKIFKK